MSTGGGNGQRFVPRLTVKEIRAWARAHKERTDKRLTRDSGEIPEALGETWKQVDQAYYWGHRGLPGGSSLAQLPGRGRRG
jgi:hypothetical protein